MSTKAEQIERSGRGFTVLVLAIIIIAVSVSVASYAATVTSSTVNITALGTTSGGVADVFDIGVNFKSVKKKGKKDKGVIISRFQLGSTLDSDKFIADVIWTNSKDVKGILKSHDAFLIAGLYFLDSDQQKAIAGGYTGDCDDETQRETKKIVPEDMGLPAGPKVKHYLCPDTGSNSSGVMSKALAQALLISNTPDKTDIFLLADIHKPPKKDEHEDDETPGSNPGQVKKLEFAISLTRTG